MLPFISVVLVGRIGPAELAAASLGSSLLNILGLAVMAGLAGAITTLSGQVSCVCAGNVKHAVSALQSSIVFAVVHVTWNPI